MEDLGTPLPQAETGAARAHATSVRWRILALLMAYAALAHFNRISISVAGTEHMMGEFSIDPTRMGWVYSSYLIVYTLCMIPGGWVIDRFGPKRALMALGFGSAILVPMTGLTAYATPAGALLLLCVIRGALGAVSAPIHPTAARSVSLWMPYGGRGLANGLVTGAALVGISMTYYVFGSLMDAVGWPRAFVVAGGVTLLLTLAWSWYAADDPGRHPGVDARERATIEEGDPARGSKARPEGLSGFLAMLRDRSLVMLTLSYAAVSYFQYLFFYWLQFYFDDVLKLGKDDARLYMTIVSLSMAVGMMSGGWLADRAQAILGGWRGRALLPASAMVASAVLLVMGIFGEGPAWVVTCFALALGALGVCEAPIWITGVELGRDRGGLSASILNAGGNVGGLMAPIITPLFSSYFGWQAGLCLAGAVCIFGAILWWWIDPPGAREPVDLELAGASAA